ncbi:hypothetical protein D9M71_523760 [compost metagenome]
MFLDRLHRKRRLGGDLHGHCKGHVIELLRAGQAIDHAKLQGAVGIERGRAEEHLLEHMNRQVVHEAQQPAGGVRHAQIRRGHGEAGATVCHHQVTTHHQIDRCAPDAARHLGGDHARVGTYPSQQAVQGFAMSHGIAFRQNLGDVVSGAPDALQRIAAEDDNRDALFSEAD